MHPLKATKLHLVDTDPEKANFRHGSRSANAEEKSIPSKKVSRGNIRRTLWSFVGLAATTLIINLAWAAWAKARYPLVRDGKENSLGYGKIFQGTCSVANSLDTWLHFLINALSTSILAGSTAFLTAYNSPSRAEIDKAHANGNWLHIGVSSLRNFRYISKRKTVVCILLISTSLPFNLIYNSLIFTSTSVNEYRWALLREDFRDPYFWPPYHHSDYWFTKIQNGLPHYDRLDSAACLATYGQGLVSTRRDVIFVTNSSSSELVISESRHLLADYGLKSKGSVRTPSVPVYPIQKGGKHGPTVAGYHISYCLSEPVESFCSVQFSWDIMTVLLVCNAVKLLVMVFIVLSRDIEELLITVGDGMSSFLTLEDTTTTGLGLIRRGSSKTFGTQLSRTAEGKYKNVSYRWGGAVPATLWFIYSTVWIVGIVIAAAVSIDTGASPGSLGFGRLNPQTLVFATHQVSNIVVATIITNTPQIFLSAIYFMYQNIITTMFIANDYNRFALEDQALMVSSPADEQRSSWFFGVPLAAGIFLQGLQFLLHWLVSRSFFPILLTIVTADGTRLPFSRALVNCGYSPLAIILSLVTAVILLLTAWGIGSIKLKGRGPPIAATCSVAISAACHVPLNLVTDSIVHGKFRWGAVDDGSKDVGHCSFAPASAWHAGYVSEPIPGRVYT